MLVTSAAEVMVPGIFDFLDMRLDDRLRVGDLAGRQARGGSEVNDGRKPELGLTIGVRYVNVDASLFVGEEEQSEWSITDDSGCPASTLADSYLHPSV